MPTEHGRHESWLWAPNCLSPTVGWKHLKKVVKDLEKGKVPDGFMGECSQTFEKYVIPV